MENNDLTNGISEEKIHKKVSHSGRPKKGRLIYWIIIVLLLVILALTLARPVLKRKQNGMPQQGVSELGNVQETEFAVNILNTTLGPIADYYNTSGEVVSASSVDVYADTQGILAQLLVGLGDRVTDGQVIALIDPSRPGTKYALNSVKARVAGFIIRLPLNRGDFVGPSSPVATIGDLDNLQVIASIPERFISRVHKGMKAKVDLPARPGQSLQLVVDEVDPVVNPNTRTLGVKMNIPKSEKMVKAGMYAEIRLTTDKKDRVIRIPADAIQRRMGETFVYIVKEGHAHKRLVVPGIALEGIQEIIDGLTVGESVVVQGQTLLEDGVRVKVIREVRDIL